MAKYNIPTSPQKPKQKTKGKPSASQPMMKGKRDAERLVRKHNG